MLNFGDLRKSRGAMTAAAAVLIGLGAAGGAAAVHATRPPVQMAPTVQTPIARLAVSEGVVTVKGRVSEVFGDRFVLQDATGRAMIAGGREGRDAARIGQTIMVQGRFDDGQLRASYLVDASGRVTATGPRPPRPGAADGREGPGRRGAPDRRSPPPPGCGPAAAGPGAPGNMPPPTLPAAADHAGGSTDIVSPAASARSSGR